MAMNNAGQKGYVPQNYLEVEGLDPEASIDQVVAGIQRQDSVTSQGSTGSWGMNSAYAQPPALSGMVSHPMDTILEQVTPEPDVASPPPPMPSTAAVPTIPGNFQTQN